MVKLWDQKICNLRNELNIQGLKVKLGKMANKEEVNDQILELNKNKIDIDSEIDGIKKQLNSKDNSMREINDKIEAIYMRQQEVVIGKRNVNCLSCAGGTLEPIPKEVKGTDGKVYRGIHSPNKTRGNSIEKDNNDSPKKLLDMKKDQQNQEIIIKMDKM